jgi:hypothetical protein
MAEQLFARNYTPGKSEFAVHGIIILLSRVALTIKYKPEFKRFPR